MFGFFPAMTRLQIMSRVIIVFVVLWFFSFGSGQAFAQCDCAPAYINISPHNEFRLAEVVFVGKVIQVTKTSPEPKTGAYDQIVRFEVMRVWKKDLPSIVTIKNRIDFCSNGFAEGEEWLLYAYKNRSGGLCIFCCCTRTRLLIKAEKDLKEFEAKGEKPMKVIETSSSPK